jgi:hypothetical protein
MIPLERAMPQHNHRATNARERWREKGGGEISAGLPILCVEDAGQEKGYVTLARDCGPISR